MGTLKRAQQTFNIYEIVRFSTEFYRLATMNSLLGQVSKLRETSPKLVATAKQSKLISSVYYRSHNKYKSILINREIELALASPDVTLIYQMGKVGSSSIQHTLRKTQSQTAIFHIHSLNRNHIENKLIKSRKYAGEYIEPVIFQAQSLSRKIPWILREKNVKVISITREPIARLLSSFFQNIHRHIPDFYAKHASDKVDVKEAIEAFWDFAPKSIEYYFNWFERELKTVLDIDVLATPFAKDVGYSIQSPSPKLQILMLKLESFDSSLKEALNKYYSVSNINIHSKNVSHKKTYNQLYQEFRENIRFSPEYLDSIYSRPLVQHFYTAAEIAEFKKRWQLP